MAICESSQIGLCFRYTKRCALLLFFSGVLIYLVMHYMFRPSEPARSSVYKYQHPRFGKILNVKAWEDLSSHREKQQVVKQQMLTKIYRRRRPGEKSGRLQNDAKSGRLKNDEKSRRLQFVEKSGRLKNDEKSRRLQFVEKSGRLKNEKSGRLQNEKSDQLQNEEKFERLQDHVKFGKHKGMKPKAFQQDVESESVKGKEEPEALKFQPRMQKPSSHGKYGNLLTNNVLVSPKTVDPSSTQLQQSMQRLITTLKQQSNKNVSKSTALQRLKPGHKRRFMDQLTTSSGENCGDYNFQTNDVQLQVFKPVVRGRDLCVLVDTVKTLSKALQTASIPFFLTRRSLLGSWRHHGLVPWDDGVDIAVDYRYQRYIQDVLMKLKPDYQFKIHHNTGKFFSSSASRNSAVTWRWPFVEVHFFSQNATHVFEVGVKTNPTYAFPKRWVFPLVLRPFQGLSLPCPARSRLVVEHMYSVDRCERRRFTHEGHEVSSVACYRLRSVYPFVVHVPLKGRYACVEAVTLHGAVVRQLVLNNSVC